MFRAFKHDGRQRAALKLPQSRRSAIVRRLTTARNVWTAGGSPPLSCAARHNSVQVRSAPGEMFGFERV